MNRTLCKKRDITRFAPTLPSSIFSSSLASTNPTPPTPKLGCSSLINALAQTNTMEQYSPKEEEEDDERHHDVEE